MHYVDDILASCADIASEEHFKRLFESKWDHSPNSGGLATALLGMSTLHNEASGSVALNQASMIEDIATTFGATSGRHWETPMAEKIDPSYIDEEGDLDTSKFNYPSICGCLLFVVTHTRPDCSTACSMLCSAMSKPQQRHYNAAVRLARYLFLTKTMGLVYSADMTDPLRNKLVAYCDASWSSEAGSRSRAGYIVKLNGATVCYKSKLISSICLSCAESETSACVMCTKDIIWLRMLLYELGYTQPTTRVYGDNTAMIQSATGNNGQRKDSRYYQMRTEFLKEIVRSGVAHLEFIPTNFMASDGLTKNLSPATFMRHQPTIMGEQPAVAATDIDL